MVHSRTIRIAFLNLVACAPFLTTPEASARTLATGDFNDDGFTDMAVGVPYEFVGAVQWAGAVHVIYGSNNGLDSDGDQFWHQNTSGIPDSCETNDQFGWAIAAGDFDRDGFDDLAIAASGEQSQGGHGVLHILYGSNDGLRTNGNQIFYQDDITGTFELAKSFTALIAGDFDDDGFDDLAIGDPEHPVNGNPSAGAVHILYGSGSGLSLAGAQRWSQNSSGILESAEEGDAFGANLATGDFDEDGFDDLAISAHQEVIGGIVAGAVHVIYGSGGGLNSTGSQLWTQAAPGLTGDTHESGFGRSLAAGDFDSNGKDDLAIGAPAFVVDGIAGGAVHILYSAGNGLRVDGDDLFHQNKAGIANEVESGDDFAAALATGDFDNDDHDDLAIGVPLEDFFFNSSGAAHVLYGTPNGLKAQGSQFLTQGGAGLEGEIGPNRLGGALAAGDFDNNRKDDLALAAQLEEVDGITGAGVVHVLYGTTSGLTLAGEQSWDQNSNGISDSCESFDQFGGR